MNKNSPYDLNQLGVGFNQPCPRCGFRVRGRITPYQTIGFNKFCKCNHVKKKTIRKG